MDVSFDDIEIWKLFDTLNIEADDSVPEKNVSNDECKNCNKKNTLISNAKDGIIVCNDCGMIYYELIDCTPEWKMNNDDTASNGRYGMATNFFLPQSSLGTTIAGSQYNRLKRLHNWGAMPYRERSLLVVLEDINVRCEKYGIKKNIIDTAKLMYKKISEYKHFKGKNKGKYIIIRGSNRKSLIAACVFFACKINGTTRSPKEIAKIFELKITDITKGCKKFLQLMKNYDTMYTLDSSTPEHFIARYCNALNIHKNYIEIAIIISKNVKCLGLASDHTPPSIAAGSILLMSKINNLALTKKIISKKFSISEVTISKIYNKIEEHKKILVDTQKTQELSELMHNMDDQILDSTKFAVG